MKPEKHKFASEADLCAEFVRAVERLPTTRNRPDDGWRAYPETAGFDLLLVRRDGFQVGVEAKLALNAKVVAQALPDSTWLTHGPDCRAVLVPEAATNGLGAVCAHLGLTVLRLVDWDPYAKVRHWRISPDLPAIAGWAAEAERGEKSWHEWCVTERCPVPDYVPDVAAGASAPLALTPWKVSAIKLVVLLEERPVTRADFKALDLSPSRWTAPFPGWLRKTAEGWVAGPALPDFRAQHPRNFEEIRADRDRWGSNIPRTAAAPTLALSQGGML